MITALLVSLVLLVLNAFFVAAEFALVASKRHRLDELAERGSRAAAAAAAGSRELSLMLAGAQLGITLCTLGLGSVAKPAVADLLAPVLTFLRLPEAAAYVVAVVLAVGIVGAIFMLMTTTAMVDGRPISRYLGIVTGEAIIGANIFRDIFAGVRDIVGGRSGTYEKALGEAREVAMTEMQARAQELGANAVVGIDLDYEVLGQNNGMLMVAVSGTAVVC